MNYKATRTPPKFQIRNKGAFIYYVINIGGGGGNQNAYVQILHGSSYGQSEQILRKFWKTKWPPKLQN